jgi:hypothetical protein
MAPADAPGAIFFALWWRLPKLMTPAESRSEQALPF